MNTRAMRLGILGIGIVLLLVGTVSAAPSAACVNPSSTTLSVLNVMWGNVTHPLSPGPGSYDVPLTVTLQSSGNNCALENVEAVLQMYALNVTGVRQLISGITNFNGTSTATVYEPEEAGYSNFNIVFNVNLANNAIVGPDEAFVYPLYVYWTYSGNVTGRASQEFDIPVPFKGSPDLVFNSEGSSLIAGQVNNITIDVSNIGSAAATGIDIPIPSSTGVEMLSKPSEINTLEPGASANISFSVYVPPTLGGEELTLSPYYENPYGYNTSISDGLGLYVIEPEGTLNITASTDTLVTGKINNIWINLTNSGVSAISDLVVSFAPGSSLSLLGSDGIFDVSKIPPSGEVSIPLSLYSTSSSSVTSITVTMDYAAGSISRTLNFLTPGYINLSVESSSVLPSEPQPGSIFSLTSTLNNIGTTTAQAVSVTPEPPSGITVLGDSTTFVGSMAAYTPTAFTVSFTSSSSLSPGLYVIPIKVTYANNIDQQVSTVIDYTVGVGVASSGVIATSGNTLSTSPGSGFGSGNFIRRNFTGGNYVGGGAVYRNGTGVYRNVTSSTGQHASGSTTGAKVSSKQFYVYIGAAVVVIAVAIGAFIFLRRRTAGNKGDQKAGSKEEQKKARRT